MVFNQDNCYNRDHLVNEIIENGWLHGANGDSTQPQKNKNVFLTDPEVLEQLICFDALTKLLGNLFAL